MSMDVVTVSRLTVNCTVPRDHPNIGRVRWRLDEVAGPPLRHALEELLAPLGRLHSDEVVIIRRLELSFDLDTSGALPDLARRWAARLALKLARSLEEGARTSGMVRFSDAAHFLARFLVDAAAGRSAGKWYYRRWRGLEPLAIPAVLRTAILEDAEQGLAALRSLPPAELVPVLEALGPGEARQVIETVAQEPGDGADFERAAEALIPCAPMWRTFASALHSPWTGGLALLALAWQPKAAPLPAVARLAASVAAWLGAEHQATVTGGEAPPELAPLAAISRTRREQLAAAFGKPKTAGAAAKDELVSMYTPFGGVVLLLPHIAALPIDRISENDRAWARLLVLARCAGASRYSRALADPVLQHLCGLDASETDRVAECDHALDPAEIDPMYFAPAPDVPPCCDLAAHHVLRAFARRLPGFSDSSPAYLYENFLAFPATLEGSVCRMGRPPLGALLGITGALRGRIAVPWLEPIELHSGG